MSISRFALTIDSSGTEMRPLVLSSKITCSPSMPDPSHVPLVVQIALAQKKKWARTHRTRPPRSEQAKNYTGRMWEKQAGDRQKIVPDYATTCLDYYFFES